MSKAVRIAKSVPRGQKRLNKMMGNNTPPTTPPRKQCSVGEALEERDARIKAEGIAEGLRIAAEIARKEQRQWHVKSGRQRKHGDTDLCAQSRLCSLTAGGIAEAIEAAAKGRKP